MAIPLTEATYIIAHTRVASLRHHTYHCTTKRLLADLHHPGPLVLSEEDQVIGPAKRSRQKMAGGLSKVIFWRGGGQR